MWCATAGGIRNCPADGELWFTGIEKGGLILRGRSMQHPTGQWGFSTRIRGFKDVGPFWGFLRRFGGIHKPHMNKKLFLGGGALFRKDVLVSTTKLHHNSRVGRLWNRGNAVREFVCTTCGSTDAHYRYDAASKFAGCVVNMCQFTPVCAQVGREPTNQIVNFRIVEKCLETFNEREHSADFSSGNVKTGQKQSKILRNSCEITQIPLEMVRK